MFFLLGLVRIALQVIIFPGSFIRPAGRVSWAFGIWINAWGSPFLMSIRS